MLSGTPRRYIKTADSGAWWIMPLRSLRRPGLLLRSSQSESLFVARWCLAQRDALGSSAPNLGEAGASPGCRGSTTSQKSKGSHKAGAPSARGRSLVFCIWCPAWRGYRDCRLSRSSLATGPPRCRPKLTPRRSAAWIFVTSSANFFFCDLDLPGHIFTITCGMIVSLESYCAGLALFSNTSFATGMAENAFGQPT